MKFEKPLLQARLIRRYKRFLADMLLYDGSIVIAHCTNSGSMISCIEVGAEVLLSESANQERKTKYTWEMIKINDSWVGVNTMHPNKIVFDAVKSNAITGLPLYSTVRREVKWGDSRFDLMAVNEYETCFIEVKNVTMKLGEYALFPDSVTSRGRKHLETLMNLKDNGFRAVMVYVIQRSDVDKFSVADTVDPGYGVSLRKAMQHSVEVFVLQVDLNPEEILIRRQLPITI